MKLARMHPMLCLSALTVVCLSWRQPIACGAPPPPLLPAEQDEAVGLRVAGTHGDRTRVRQLMAHIHADETIPGFRNSLRALAQLGAAEALPALDKAMQQFTYDPDLWDFTAVERARLVAEAFSSGEANPARRAQGKIGRFYAEMQISPEAIMAGVTAHYANGGHDYGEQPREVYALRAVADMVYQGPYRSFAALPGVAQLDFSKDFPASLKMKLAPLSREQRIAWIVDDLSRMKILTMDHYLEVQLAADEGTLASGRAAAKLREMLAHREQYPDHGFDALVQIIFGVGDRVQLPLVEELMQHAGTGYTASAFHDLFKNGFRRLWAPGY